MSIFDRVSISRIRGGEVDDVLFMRFTLAEDSAELPNSDQSCMCFETMREEAAQEAMKHEREQK